MKNKKNTSWKIVLLLILSLSTLSFGQNSNTIKAKKAVAQTREMEPCKLISFTAKTVEGKSYICWCASSLSDNYYFILEKSFDGTNYSIVKITKCFISPPNQKLQYSFIDDKIVSSENTYYRITLNKIEEIDVECKLISLSPTNMFEKDNNTFILTPGQKQEIIAKISKQ